MSQPEDRRVYREGVLIFSAMILSGIVTVTASVWIIRSTDLVQVSVREERATSRIDQLKANRTPPRPVAPIRQESVE